MSGGDRSSADARLIALLAGGLTREEAARQAGVSERTIYRRLQTAEFRGAVQAARDQMVSEAVGQLVTLSAAATATLRKLLEARSEHVRLLACRAILELGKAWREGESLEKRIVDLEEKLSRQSTGSPSW